MEILGTLCYNNMILGSSICFIFNNLKCIMNEYQLLKVGLFCFVPRLEHWADVHITSRLLIGMQVQPHFSQDLLLQELDIIDQMWVVVEGTKLWTNFKCGFQKLLSIQVMKQVIILLTCDGPGFPNPALISNYSVPSW